MVGSLIVVQLNFYAQNIYAYTSIDPNLPKKDLRV
jgi:hypothetical protein